MVKQAGRAALAGMVVGVIVLGLGGRVAMRFVALLIHQAPHLGVGATLGILLIGGILGTLSGAAYGVILQRRWPARVTMKGFLFGSVLFSVLVLLQPPAIRAEVAAAELNGGQSFRCSGRCASAMHSSSRANCRRTPDLSTYPNSPVDRQSV